MELQLVDKDYCRAYYLGMFLGLALTADLLSCEALKERLEEVSQAYYRDLAKTEKAERGEI